MKNLLFALAALISLPAFAGNVTCEVQEIPGGTESPVVQKITLAESENVHDTIHLLTFTKFTDVKGLLAVDHGIMIIHVYHEPTGFASTSHSDISAGRGVHHQFLMSGSSGIVIDCLPVTNTEK